MPLRRAVLSAAIGTAITLSASAQTAIPETAGTEKSIRVTVREEVTAQGTVYHYTVTNYSDEEIRQFWVGYHPEGENFELRHPPKGWTFKDGLPADSAWSTHGWKIEVYTQEEAEEVSLNWCRCRDDNERALGPGKSATFSVIVDKPERTYLTSHWSVVYSNSTTASGTSELVPATKRVAVQRETSEFEQIDVQALKGKTPADLKALFPEMKAQGSLWQVSNWRGWKDVTMEFNSTGQLAAITLTTATPLTLEDAQKSAVINLKLPINKARPLEIRGAWVYRELSDSVKTVDFYRPGDGSKRVESISVFFDIPY